jgi:PAS domain S-box-containing protein
MGGSARALVAYPEQLSAVLLETIPEALVLSDSRGRIVMVNGNSEKLFGYAREELLGKKMEVLVPARIRARHRVFHCRYNANPTVRPMTAGVPLFGRRKDGSEFPAEIILGPLQIDDKTFVWSAIRDVTERERLISQLRAALKEVNMLRGLLSICASCKRIRDERGAWQPMESYIQSHSQAKFSHGLCTECIRKLYPDYRREKRQAGMPAAAPRHPR